MKTGLFVAIVLISGCFAGIVQATTNLAIVEPYLDEAIGIENQNLFASGEEEDTPEFWVEYYSYRGWQKGGQFLAGAIYGTALGSLFGIIFVLSRKVLPEGNNVKKSLVLAGIMWTTIFLIPFLKYPSNPPTVGDADTVVLRSILYLSFITISGFGAVGFYQIFKRLQSKKFLAFVGYAIFISVVFFVMPENPDQITAPMDLVNGFRLMSAIAITTFWITVAVILGALWQKYKSKLENSSYEA